MPFDIEARIEEWRNELLDTTKRNRLIHFRTGRGGGIALIHPDPGDFWHRLVIAGKPLTFARKCDLLGFPDEAAEGDPDDPPLERPGPNAAAILERCLASPNLLEEHLLTDMPDRHLARRLTRLHLAARASLDEQGVVTLHVAFGFLRWFEETNSQVELRSPLLLVPVRLQREGIDAPWQLLPEDEELLVNHTLAQRLAADFRLRLPAAEGDADNDLDWRSYLGEVEECVKSQARWEVLDETALGTFNFQKLAMWQDLGDNAGRIRDHGLCGMIAGDRGGALGDALDLPHDKELDEKTRPEETYHILDADSSQHAAIVAASRGANLVLDGPPGTGKSQTIANVIADSLAAGKTVLFVSEKAAALDVVHRRLCERGLGDFVLACHSHKANKREVVAELGRCLDLPPEEDGNPADDLRQLDTARRELSVYVRELEAVRKPLGRSAFQVHGELARLTRLGSKSHGAVPSVLSRDGAYVERVAGLLNGLTGCRDAVGDRDRHPWRDCRVVASSLVLQEDAQHHLGRLAEQVRQAATEAAELNRLGFGQERPSRAEWLATLENVRRALLTPSWWDPAKRQELLQLTERWLDCDGMAKRLRDELAVRLGEIAFAPESAPLAFRASRFRSSWARLLPGWWFLKPRVKVWYKQRPPQTVAFHDDLDKLARYHECSDFCRQAQAERAADLLTDNRGKPDWAGTKKCLQQIERLEQVSSAGREPAPRVILQGVLDRCDALRAEGFDESWTFLTAKLFDPARDVSTGLTIDRTPLEDLCAWFGARAVDVGRIDEWVRYSGIERQLREDGAEPILKEVTGGRVALGEAANAFRRRFLGLWLEAVSETTPVLSRFTTEDHERRIARFQELDRRSVAGASARVRHVQLTHPDRPRPVAGAPVSSELGTLLHEVHKSRRHLPLRQLFKRIPRLLLRLKPCVMMSPLAVSTYLQSPDLNFDLVIFDEASQVRPHDAICAIYRGRRLLVAGDQKQLPPTDFFQRVFGDEEPDDEADTDGLTLSDFPSLLDVCQTFGLPRYRLRWHYRSKREALIAFSNRHYYDSELITFPSAHDTPNNPAVGFEYVAEGRWKPGAGGGFNAVEARRTAELILAHARHHPDQTLGVIAFSQRQQMRILDELEQMRRSAPELEEFFSEDREHPFFVKNLETVQGDERDVIFLSIGYGPDETGRVAMRFGPLNKAGGERRLNVAVTRARQGMTVVSSLRAADIDLSRTNAEGVRLLRAYLDYAERGVVVALGGTLTEVGRHGFDSPFEEEVFAELTRRGLTLHPQVGCSGFRIDLAVVDPGEPGRYLLGVECDGATYHSAATARDRDRLRQEVLESLGWRICRIWSTDWVRDPERQIGRVMAAVERARREGPPLPAAGSPLVVGPEREPRQASVMPQTAPEQTRARRSYPSIDAVPEEVVHDELLKALRKYGATPEDDLIRAVRDGLGFTSTRIRIKARIKQSLEALVGAGRICRAADQRLQLPLPCRTTET